MKFCYTAIPAPSISPLKNKTVTKGDPIHLLCNATGNPTPNVSWSKAGGTIYPLYVSGNVLRIPRAKLSDAGKYICTARSVRYTTTVEAFVTVKCKCLMKWMCLRTLALIPWAAQVGQNNIISILRRVELYCQFVLWIELLWELMQIKGLFFIFNFFLCHFTTLWFLPVFIYLSMYPSIHTLHWFIRPSNHSLAHPWP